MVVASSIDYQTLSYLKDYSSRITEDPGVYYWVFWPSYHTDSVDLPQLREIIEYYSRVNLNESEHFERFKFRVSVEESWLTSKGTATVLGLSTAKTLQLDEFLDGNVEHIRQFAAFFKRMCFLRPFYIGKATNLRRRLRQHFAESTIVLPTLRAASCRFADIWIGYEPLLPTNDESIAAVLEEVAQRIAKPGLTARPG